jgi:hypothetical protein
VIFHLVICCVPSRGCVVSLPPSLQDMHTTSRTTSWALKAPKATNTVLEVLIA